MASMTVQNSLMKDHKPRGDGELVRCPHCEQHFYHGGEVDRRETDQEAHGFEADRREINEGMRKTDEYAGRGHGRSAEAGRVVGFAEGGRVDGSGKVDGIHLHPSECSHLAAGGVCRHMPGRARGDDNAGDPRIRNFSDGGMPDSFPGYLAKRRAGRGR